MAAALVSASPRVQVMAVLLPDPILVGVCVGVNRISTQALTEAAARYTEKMDQSRELFLGMLGHDLRNPLGATCGFTELHLLSKTPDRHAHFASRILTCATRMSHMITD